MYDYCYKRYEYWHTGKNTEVLRFEQTFNNAFYNVVLLGAGVSTTALAFSYHDSTVIVWGTAECCLR
jgi:hypothetical protein